MCSCAVYFSTFYPVCWSSDRRGLRDLRPQSFVLIQPDEIHDRLSCICTDKDLSGWRAGGRRSESCVVQCNCSWCGFQQRKDSLFASGRFYPWSCCCSRCHQQSSCSFSGMLQPKQHLDSLSQISGPLSHCPLPSACLGLSYSLLLGLNCGFPQAYG